MKNKKKLIGYSVIAIFLLMQLYPMDEPSVSMENPNDIIANNDIPVKISKMLKDACYDCHSNETVYPWYSYVAPVKFLVYRDTKVGREELNFSDWTTLSSLDQASALGDISSEVLDGDMPMKIYPLTHPEAKLSDNDRELISNWADGLAEGLFE